MNSEDTSGPVFWKSTRKILAASRSMYEKLGGSQQTLIGGSTLCNTAKTTLIHLCKGHAGLRGKREQQKRWQGCRKMAGLQGSYVDEVIRRLDNVDRRLDIFDDLKKAFECCICKPVCRKPIVAPCCRRVIGCDGCIKRWLTNELQFHSAMWVVRLLTSSS